MDIEDIQNTYELKDIKEALKQKRPKWEIIIKNDFCFEVVFVDYLDHYKCFNVVKNMYGFSLFYEGRDVNCIKTVDELIDVLEGNFNKRKYPLVF